jgi:PleD family two-component response regulator
MTTPEMPAAPVEQIAMVSCLNCRSNFDAVPASFCECIARERTFACPYCGCCACHASYDQRQRFLVSSPAVLHERRRRERTEGIARLQATDPKKVQRPLALIVDDDPLVLAVAERVVRAAGYSTLVTSSPEEAMDIADALLPDVVLTDALMPRLDGRELCRRLKFSDRTENVKVIVMSSLYRGIVHRNQAFKVFGVDEYLCKPIKPAVLRDALNRVLPPVAHKRVLLRIAS